MQQVAGEINNYSKIIAEMTGRKRVGGRVGTRADVYVYIF